VVPPPLPNNIFALCDPWSLGICGKVESLLSEFACFRTYTTIVCTKAGEKKNTKKPFIPLLISHLSILFDLIICFDLGVCKAMEYLLWI
jgi:hypothetical protein